MLIFQGCDPVVAGSLDRGGGGWYLTQIVLWDGRGYVHGVLNYRQLKMVKPDCDNSRL